MKHKHTYTVVFRRDDGERITTTVRASDDGSAYNHALAEAFRLTHESGLIHHIVRVGLGNGGTA